MLSEILKIKPQLDQKDLNQMDRQLGSRFTKIAKGFGKSLKVASALALGAAVLDKLINPLQEVKAAIDRTLGKADDVVTNAKQFNTSTENLLKIRALGNAKGLTNENIDQLITKFQGAVAQAKNNPNDPANSSVRNFIDQKDTAVAFYDFITQLQKMDRNQQVLVQQQVFGEKQVLKMAEFLQDVGFKESSKALAGINFAQVAAAVENLGDLADKNEENRTVRDLKDLINKSNVISGATVSNLNRSEVNNLRRENGRIARSGASFTAEERMADIQENLEKLTNDIITQLPILMTGLNSVVDLLRESVKGWKMIFDLLKNSTIVRGIKGWFGSKDGE